MIGGVTTQVPIEGIMVQVVVDDLITEPTVLITTVEIADLLGVQKAVLSEIT